jgi:hypothetical protein
MILVNGCSYTQGMGLAEPDKHAWPVLLQPILKKRVHSIAEGGKCNQEMYNQLVTWLIWAKRGKAELPETIIWQTTHHDRMAVRLLDGSGAEKFNDLHSQLSNYNGRYLKLDSNGTRQKLDLRRHEAKKRKDYKVLQEIMDIGIGDFVLNTDEFGYPINIRPLGDTTNRSGQLKQCINIFSLQALCKSMGVRIIILNYDGNPISMKGDPLFESIDRDDYVIHNSRYHGLYQELIKHNFDRFECGHFNVDAHLYQADIVANFYNDYKQINVSERNYQTTTSESIFRYTIPQISNKTVMNKLKMGQK